MLEHYNNINSVCAQKVRLALSEKGIQATEHMLKLRGDQFDPAYLKLNPNAVVPTLVHDGNVVTESSVILYYLDEAFPDKPLMPPAPLDRVKVRMFNKFVDEYLHNSCMIMTFSTAFRPAYLKVSAQERDADFARSPVPKRAEYKSDVINHGLDSVYVREALAHHQKLFKMMNEQLSRGPYLAGNAYSLAECAVIPYIVRLELLRLSGLWDKHGGIADWWQRMRTRPSTQAEIFARMGDADWAPFKNLEADPWPKVQQLLKAA